MSAETNPTGSSPSAFSKEAISQWYQMAKDTQGKPSSSGGGDSNILSALQDGSTEKQGFSADELTTRQKTDLNWKQHKFTIITSFVTLLLAVGTAVTIYGFYPHMSHIALKATAATTIAAGSIMFLSFLLGKSKLELELPEQARQALESVQLEDIKQHALMQAIKMKFRIESNWNQHKWIMLTTLVCIALAIGSLAAASHYPQYNLICMGVSVGSLALGCGVLGFYQIFRKPIRQQQTHGKRDFSTGTPPDSSSKISPPPNSTAVSSTPSSNSQNSSGGSSLSSSSAPQSASKAPPQKPPISKLDPKILEAHLFDPRDPITNYVSDETTQEQINFYRERELTLRLFNPFKIYHGDLKVSNNKRELQASLTESSKWRDSNLPIENFLDPIMWFNQLNANFRNQFLEMYSVGSTDFNEMLSTCCENIISAYFATFWRAKNPLAFQQAPSHYRQNNKTISPLALSVLLRVFTHLMQSKEHTSISSEGIFSFSFSNLFENSKVLTREMCQEIAAMVKVAMVIGGKDRIILCFKECEFESPEDFNLILQAISENKKNAVWEIHYDPERIAIERCSHYHTMPSTKTVYYKPEPETKPNPKAYKQQMDTIINSSYGDLYPQQFPAIPSAPPAYSPQYTEIPTDQTN